MKLDVSIVHLCMVSKNLYRSFLKIPCLILCITLLQFCEPAATKPKKTSLTNNYQEIKIKRVKFNFDQLFEIREIKKGTSISDLRISGIGFPNSSHTIAFESVSPLESFFIADIDTDGFEELYIITRSVGSGSYAKIIGISSNKGKSYKSIYIPEYDSSLTLELEYLKGYMGYDSIYLKNNNLYREFPVFKPSDTNSNPTGGTCKIAYKLVEINNSFSLQIKSFHIVD